MGQAAEKADWACRHVLERMEEQGQHAVTEVMLMDLLDGRMRDLGVGSWQRSKALRRWRETELYRRAYQGT